MVDHVELWLDGWLVIQPFVSYLPILPQPQIATDIHAQWQFCEVWTTLVSHNKKQVLTFLTH